MRYRRVTFQITDLVTIGTTAVVVLVLINQAVRIVQEDAPAPPPSISQGSARARSNGWTSSYRYSHANVGQSARELSRCVPRDHAVGAEALGGLLRDRKVSKSVLSIASTHSGTRHIRDLVGPVDST